jgi:hypothetical protein
MSTKRFSTLLGLLLVLASGMMLVACGPSGSSPAGDSNGSGRVGIVITDGPSSEFAEVNVTITQISLIPADDYLNNGPVVVFQGEEKVNLLDLANFSELFALSDQVPAGSYEKIRLQLKQPDGIELVRKDPQGNVIETLYPPLTGNGKLDLNPRTTFQVQPNLTLYLQVDFDADKSIHIVHTGNGGYRFRPVVFVDMVDSQFSGKLVRHFGYVRDLDVTNHQFRLCAQSTSVDNGTATATTAGVSPYHYDGCIRVSTVNASVFQTDGAPVDLTALQNDAPLTAIGFVRSYDEAETSSDNTDGDTTASVARSGQSSGDGHEMRLYAEVIELGAAGSFAVVDGIVASEPQAADDRFDLDTSDAGVIGVQLQTGTKVFSRRGERLDYQGISNGLPAAVDGVYAVDDASLLNSALVIVDTAMMATVEKLHGTILAVDGANNAITISTDGGDKLLRLGANSKIFLLQDTGSDGTLSDLVDISALPADATVDAYGHTAGDGYFDVDTLIAEMPANL